MGQTRLDGFNDRIIALYGRGMTTHDIQAHLRELYDALMVKIRDGVVANRPVYLAVGIDTDGVKPVLPDVGRTDDRGVGEVLADRAR